MAALALPFFGSVPAGAGQEIVLRLSGSDFEIGGELRSFDGRRYIVAAPGFGELSLEVSRYACVAGACTSAVAGGRDGRTVQPATLEFAPTGGTAPAHIVLAGSPALETDLLPALVRGYARHLGGTARQHIGIDAGTASFQINDARGQTLADIAVNRRATEAVFGDLAAGSATLGATTRPVAAAELAALPQPEDRSGLAREEHVLGLDGLAVVVAPGSPASRLPASAVARILSGEVRDWSGVGLPPGPIQVYATGTTVPDALAVLLGRKPGLAVAASATRVADEAALSDAVARDPAGIGVASLSQLRSARGLDITLGCGITARASDFAVKTEDYPLVRRLFLYAKGQPGEPLAQELIRFAVSPEAQPAIRDGGVVDQSIVFADEADERRRIGEALSWTRGGPAARALTQQLAADAGQARRLSTTLRFQINSADLDAKARGDIQRLARLLAQPEMRGRTVKLAGFTDASGKPDVNAALSLKRAQEVRLALIEAIAASGGRGALPDIEARGYGPAAPVACNGGDAGQHRNRRVEVWLRDAGAPAIASTTTPSPAKAGRSKGARAVAAAANKQDRQVKQTVGKQTVGRQTANKQAQAGTKQKVR